MTWWMWVLVVFIYLIVADWVEVVSTRLKNQRRTLWFLLHVLTAPIWIPLTIINGFQKLAEGKKQKRTKTELGTRLDEFDKCLAEHGIKIKHLTEQVASLIKRIDPTVEKRGLK